MTTDPGTDRFTDRPSPTSAREPSDDAAFRKFAHRRGHRVVYIAGSWRWKVTGRFLRIGSQPDDPPCVLCHELPTPEGHDACLGTIEGAAGACCGHGVTAGYVQRPGEGPVPIPLRAERCNTKIRLADLERGQPMNNDDIDTVARAITDLIGIHGVPQPPRGYPHSGLAIIDAVFSLQAQYNTHVVPVINRYCDKSIPRLASPGARFDDSIAEYTVAELAADLDGLDDRSLVELFGNRQFSPGTKIRKARTVCTLATALRENQLVDCESIGKRWDTDDVERQILAIRGVGIATWRYVLSLSGVERIKPDSMISRWLTTCTRRRYTSRAAAELLEAAIDRYNDGRNTVSVRAVDHLIWRAQSGRLAAQAAELPGR